MVFGKIKPVATIVAQFAAGVEVECIQHEGKMFMPVIAGDFDTVDDGKKIEDSPAPKKSAPKPAPQEEEAADEKVYTEDELIDNIADVLEDFDSGKKNKKKAVAAIIAFAENEDDVDATAVSEALSDFEDDEKASIDVMAEQIAKLLTKKKGKSTAAKSKKKPAEPEGEDVEIDDLEKGDLVAVYWDDEETKGWFNGKVSSIKKGIVKVKYDDGSEDDLDPEVHTKIRRLEE